MRKQIGTTKPMLFGIRGPWLLAAVMDDQAFFATTHKPERYKEFIGDGITLQKVRHEKDIEKESPKEKNPFGPLGSDIEWVEFEIPLHYRTGPFA